MISAIGDTANRATATATATASRSVNGDGRSFLEIAQALGRKVSGDDPALREAAAAQLVSELFFTPLLAEMRKFPFGRELATGGQTESAFGQKLDQRIADTVAGRSPGVVGQVMRYFEPAGQRTTVAGPGGDRATWPVTQETRSATATAREVGSE